MHTFETCNVPATHHILSSSSWSFCWSDPPCCQRLLPPQSVWSSCSYHHGVMTAWRATGSYWRAWSSFQLCKSHGWGPQRRWCHICLHIKKQYMFNCITACRQLVLLSESKRRFFKCYYQLGRLKSNTAYWTALALLIWAFFFNQEWALLYNNKFTRFC